MRFTVLVLTLSFAFTKNAIAYVGRGLRVVSNRSIWPGKGLQRYEGSSDGTSLPTVCKRGVSGVFESAIGNDLSKKNVEAWLQDSEELAGSYRTLRDRDALLSEYFTLLSLASVTELDPLTMTTFDVLSAAIVDALIKIENAGAPITDLIDKVTDVHLNFVEEFQFHLDDSGSGNFQSTNQEFLAYQFAGLVYRTYSKISRGLGPDFDMSSQAVNMRTNNWVSTIYARLQRRFVRFLASNVEEKVEEQNAASFEGLIERFRVEIVPPYTFSKRYIYETMPRGEYPPWDLTASLMTIVRNVISDADKERLEPSVVRHFQNEISAMMRRVSRPLAALALETDGELRGKQIVSTVDDVMRTSLVALLNCGHASVAAVLSLWQVRHNIVGEENAEGCVVKDFLRSVSFGSKEEVLESIPQNLRRGGIIETVNILLQDVESKIGDRDRELIRCAALLAHAVRSTSSEEFRALITYNTEFNDFSGSRDTLYQLLLRSVVEAALDPASASLDMTWLLENLVALAALEETLGVREPRSACIASFKESLHSTALALVGNLQDSVVDGTLMTTLSDRVTKVEAALVVINRLPEETLSACRLVAFKSAIDDLMSVRGNQSIDFATGRQHVENLYPTIAGVLGLSLDNAKDYVLSLGHERFDRAIGRILMSADLISGSNKEASRRQGEQSRDQLLLLADDVTIPRDAAKQRILLVGGVVFESMIETALEEHRRMNDDLADAALRKASNLQSYPMWNVLHEDDPDIHVDVTKVAAKMTVSRLGLQLVQEVLRMLDKFRMMQLGGVSGEDSGWGSVRPAADTTYADFLIEFRQVLIDEYSQASLEEA